MIRKIIIFEGDTTSYLIVNFFSSGNPLLKIAMGEGFVRPQHELTKQKMIAENAKRRHITTNTNTRHQQQQHHHAEVDKYSVVPNSHRAATTTTITKQQVAELLASKHGQITSPLEPQKTQLKKNGQAQITREQVNGSYFLISILKIF